MPMLSFKKKLRKLVRDPRRFFIDAALVRRMGAARLLGRIWSVQRTDRKADRAISTFRRSVTIPGLELFDVRGDAWEKVGSETIYVFFRFNSWKRNFVADYFVGERVAFVDDDRDVLNALSALDSHQQLVFILWGALDFPAVSEYAARRGISLCRMEDGFLRSVSLGSERAPALSLALDKQGIYFDATRPSDLESILNDYNFACDPDFCTAPFLITMQKYLRISKYNEAVIRDAASVLGPKTCRRVLILGQVEKDASITYGLASDWDCKKLILLAKSENPGAEIIYKPHPDVLKAFRANSHELEDLETICRVLKGPLVLADLFSEVDHVYVITSLAGMEALMHGLPVTTVGAPFYSGWGLTDDRCKVPRRKRRLTFEQLYFGAYVVYPRYLFASQRPTADCLAAMLGLASEREFEVEKQLIIFRKNGFEASKSSLPWIGRSKYWLAVVVAPFFGEVVAYYGPRIFNILPVEAIIRAEGGGGVQRVLAHLFVGALGGVPQLNDFLVRLRNLVDVSIIGEIVKRLWTSSPSPMLLRHWAWCCEQIGNTGEAREVLEILASKDGVSGPDAKGVKPLEIIALAQFELRQRNFDRAEECFLQALLLKGVAREALLGLVELFRLRFDYRSAYSLVRWVNSIEPSARGGRGCLSEAELAVLLGDSIGALASLAISVAVNPSLICAFTDDTGVDLLAAFEKLPVTDAVFLIASMHGAEKPVEFAKALNWRGNFDAAERVLMRAPPTRSDHFFMTLSQALIGQDRVAEARSLIESKLNRSWSPLMVREAMRIAVLQDDADWMRGLFRVVEERGINVGEVYRRKAMALLHDPHGYHLSLRSMGSSEILRKYFAGRYVKSIADLPPEVGARYLILAYFGPGDEIRWAGLYPEFVRECTPAKLVFACDPRLVSLFRRSFAGIEFVGVRRLRNIEPLAERSDSGGLPGSDLFRHLDEVGWECALGVDKVALQIDLLADFVRGYDSFRGAPYLKVDANLETRWALRLAAYRGKKLVGLSWRSSLVTGARSVHYLSVEDLRPLFERFPNVQYINLQYDECGEELKLLDRWYPGRILNFADLNQFDDFDGVAGLMSCLDLVLAPATAVMELAGAIGVPTLFLSNSPEAHWRQKPSSEIDVWHSSVVHVRGSVVGDKGSLIEAVCIKMRTHLERSLTAGGTRDSFLDEVEH